MFVQMCSLSQDIKPIPYKVHQIHGIDSGTLHGLGLNQLGYVVLQAHCEWTPGPDKSCGWGPYWTR